ncbi:MAG: TfoX/Sxy family protein [Ignavibacteriales bacterium]|nr:TfoX/Sxy family protein [Ignavibacteriales bacterium]
MAFDVKLADRIRKKLGKQSGLSEKKMFGGIAFMLKGNMCVGVHGKEMIVRIEPEKTEAALKEKHARIFDLSGGRPMKGWILVDIKGLKTEPALAKWIRRGVNYASSLPPK